MPHKVKPTSREKLTVWIGLVRNNIIGPYFFAGNVNGQAYLDMFNNFVVPEVVALVGVNQNGCIPRAWFLQTVVHLF